MHRVPLGRLISIVVLGVLLVVVEIPHTQAATLEQQKQQLDQQAQQAQNQANQQKSIADRAADTIKQVSGQIDQLHGTISSTNDQISTTQGKIGDLDQQTAEFESKLRSIQDQQNLLVRTLYKLEVSNPTDLLLFSDQPISVQAKKDIQFTEIQKSLAGVAQKTEDARLAVQNARDDQVRENTRLSQLKDSQQAQVSSLADYQQQQSDLQNNAQAAELTYEAKAQAARVKSSQIDNQIEAALTAAIKAHASGGTIAAKGAGVQVTEGEVIGYEGNTGYSFGAHVHEEYRVNGVPVDPTPYIKSGKLRYALASFIQTQGFGYNTGYGYLYANGFHPGLDISAPIGAPVYAPASGTKILDASYGDYGHAVAIQLSDGSVVMCAHLEY